MNRDRKGWCFAAARLSDARESSRLVRETVQLDPDFDWAYAVVAVRHPHIPEILDMHAATRPPGSTECSAAFFTAEFTDIAEVAKS